MKKVLGIFIMLLFACTSRDKNEIPTLSVDLHSSDVSFEDLFSKIEIIPLETSDSCLLVDVEKIVHVDSLLYVLDSRRPALYVFEKLAENLSITPLLFTEDYIVSKLNFDDYTCLRPFLSEQDYSKLLSREEDDNPCLVKFYFRKGGKNPGRM